MGTRFVNANYSEGQALAKHADQINEAVLWTDNAAAAGTIGFTVAQFLNASFRITSGAASTVTPPTAAAIVAALANAQAGSSFDFVLINGGSGTATWGAASGITYVNKTDPTTGKTQLYKVVVTNATPGAEAVSVIGLGGLI